MLVYSKMSLTKTDLAVILYLQTGEKVNDYTKKNLQDLTSGRNIPTTAFQDYLDYDFRLEFLGII